MSSASQRLPSTASSKTQSTPSQLSRSEAIFPYSSYDSISAITFSPDSSLVFVASWDCTLITYQVHPQTDPKHLLHAPKLNFLSAFQTITPVTSIVSISTQQAILGFSSGQVCILDTSTPQFPKLSLFYTAPSPIVSIKYNLHHDIIIILDFSTSLHVFHRLQLQSNVFPKPFFTHISPLFTPQLHSNYLFPRILTSNESLNQGKSTSTPPSPSSPPTLKTTLNSEILSPTEISPRYPITMDTYHDFCIIALPHSCDVYLITSIHSPDSPDPSSLDFRDSLLKQQANQSGDIPMTAQNQTQNQTQNQNQTQTQTATASAQLCYAFLRSTQISLSKYRSYHSPFVSQITSLQILTHTLQVGHDPTTNAVSSRRIGYSLGCLEGRAALDYISVSSSNSQLKLLIQEDEKKRFAFKCHRTVTALSPPSSTPQPSSEPINIFYPVNQIAYHVSSQTFATCGGDGMIVVWSEALKRRVSAFGGKVLPIDTVTFSPDGKYVLWSESPFYSAMINIDQTFQRRIDTTLTSPISFSSTSNSTSMNDINLADQDELNFNIVSEFGYNNVQNIDSDRRNLPTAMDSVHGHTLYNYLNSLAPTARTDLYTKFNNNCTLLIKDEEQNIDSDETIKVSHEIREELIKIIPEQEEYIERQVLSTYATGIQSSSQKNKTPSQSQTNPHRFKLFIRAVSDPMVYAKKS